MTARFCRLGLLEYQAAYALQTRLAAERAAGERGDLFLLTEHPGVFTLGRRGGLDNLMVTRESLAEAGIPLVPIERGGDITYHGRGQLVLYPIIHLRQAGLSVTEYVFRLEELMLRLARDCGVEAGRDSRNHGIWVEDRKLGSVGIAIRHGVAFHGLALNVNLSLSPFSWIRPCGLSGVRMTSLSSERGVEIGLEQATRHILRHLGDIFLRDFQEIEISEIHSAEAV
jgi:lipoyl(octanoyl) transferase